MSSIAIITARGGSKRIPKKNIREFCGKPIIAYSIEAALNSELFDEVMVSTDSEEIAEIAKRYGASVPFLRSAEASSDFATTVDVLLEVIGRFEDIGNEYDTLCCIYPTAPFVTADKLVNAKSLLNETSADSVFTVAPFSFPPQRGVIINESKVSFCYPEYEKMRSQDLRPVYHDCGQFYFCRTNSLKLYHSLVTENTAAIVVPEMEMQDIDNETDWQLAELKYSLLKESES